MNRTILKKYHIIYMERIQISSMMRESCGDRNDLPYQGLYTDLLGDESSVDALLQWLKKTEKPYGTWRQGTMVALCFFSDDTLLCVFYCTDKKGIEALHESKTVFEAFKSTGKG